MSEKNSISIKLVALGDGDVGKHDILLSYIKDKLSKIMSLRSLKIVLFKQLLKARQLIFMGYCRIRNIQQTKVIELCFQNAFTKWYYDLETPELKLVPKIFVGNNKEMRNVANPNHVQYEAAKSKRFLISNQKCRFRENFNSQNASSKKSDGKEKFLMF
ncbi:unnamed protein product [Paramecium octaurelia]|uniref:Uncharacterized protein n=1 Tax=Paramecium octaurelia TaxID=43137 RepID=A0A8S1URM4_PAROT|nr:unnamed protein product [Paramecium octaurelia]